MSDLDEIYNQEWVRKDFSDTQDEWNIVGDAIYRQFRPSRVLDVGCGPGLLLNRLKDIGCGVLGLEGSWHCIDFARKDVQEFIRHHDLREFHPAIVTLASRDKGASLVICTEVAEHIEQEHADTLIKMLCAPMCPIIFTAAPPGQDGHHHVNCQTKDYWLAKFRKHGVVIDADATSELVHRWLGLEKLSHMVRNVMVLR